jgi:hypothetical protein
MPATTFEFSKLAVAQCRSIAALDDVPAHARVFHLAVARAKPDGHAEFKHGELAQLLSRRHRDIVGAITQAIQCRLLDPKSMPTCLVVANLVEVYHRSGRAKYLKCATHGGDTTPLVTAGCHNDRKHKAHGLCDPCYRAEIRLAKAEGREPYCVPDCGEQQGTREGTVAICDALTCGVPSVSLSLFSRNRRPPSRKGTTRR